MRVKSKGGVSTSEDGIQHPQVVHIAQLRALGNEPLAKATLPDSSMQSAPGQNFASLDKNHDFGLA